MTEKSVDGRRDLRVAQINILVDLYKHHHELAVKTTTFYLIAVGFLAGYIFRPDVTGATKYALTGMVILASSLCVLACHLTRRWFNSLSESVSSIADHLQFSKMDPLAQGRTSLTIAESAAWAVLAAAFGLAFFAR